MDILAALLMYPLAYLYCWGFFGDPQSDLWLLAFVPGFVCLTELCCRREKRSPESFFWLACLLLIAGSTAFHINRVWDKDKPILFLHVFAVWWVLVRSDRLLEGKSGRFLPVDALNGFLLFPFSHFFLRLRSLASGIGRLFSDKEKSSRDRRTWLWAGLAVLAALILFVKAAGLLMDADAGFASLLESFRGLFDIRLEGEGWFYLLLSLPVGAYLFGLIGGAVREDRDALSRTAERTDSLLAGMRKVPYIVWTVLLSGFCLLYLVFFAVQGSYLLWAFRDTVPEAWTASQYAREGFFELCRVMALNFLLLWLVSRSAEKPLTERSLMRAAATFILAESMLLAVTAFSKIFLYIRLYGFTPKRLQSAWLVTVLFAGCLCVLITLFRKVKTFRGWMFFSAGALTLLCFI